MYFKNVLQFMTVELKSHFEMVTEEAFGNKQTQIDRNLHPATGSRQKKVTLVRAKSQALKWTAEDHDKDLKLHPQYFQTELSGKSL